VNCEPCICNLEVRHVGNKIPIHQAISITANYFKIEKREITNPCKARKVTIPRQMLMLYLKAQGYTFKNIGLCIGGRDHTTVMHSVKLMRNLITQDEVIKANYNALKKEMNKYCLDHL